MAPASGVISRHERVFNRHDISSEIGKQLRASGASKDSGKVKNPKGIQKVCHDVPLNVAQAAVIRVQAVLRSACDAAVEMRICGDRLNADPGTVDT